jgi:hypothetical protein
MSSVITISQPPSVPGGKTEVPTEMTFAHMDCDMDPEDLEMIAECDATRVDTSSESDPDNDSDIVPLPDAIAQARDHSLAKLQSRSTANGEGGSQQSRQCSIDTGGVSDKKISSTQAVIKRRLRNGPDAVIVLKEERVCCSLLVTFDAKALVRQTHFMTFSNTYTHSKFPCSFVFFECPAHFTARSLECTITWNNVESLMNISHKLCVPALQRECLTFLLTHAAGKPIKAMRIAELFEEEELYRESSRFVLDNPGGWSEHELSTLSQETLLKLEKR